MSNPTSNYSFQMPTNTDLVTDLPADFEVFGQAVDTRLKALQPGTTLGDLAYSSATANTNTRLGIGTTGQVLTVAAGLPSWATPAAPGGMTLLSTTTLSGASTAISSISQSYKNLRIVTKGVYASTNCEVRIRFNSITGSDYDYNTYLQSNSTVGADSGTNVAFIVVGLAGTNGTDYNFVGSGEMLLPRYTETEFHRIYYRTKAYTTSHYYANGTGTVNSTAAISGITFLVSGGTFSGGTVYIYGEN